MLVPPFPAEPYLGNIDWSDADDLANRERYGISFADIQSGFAALHVRYTIRNSDKFVALIMVDGVLIRTLCRSDNHLVILSADLANKDEQAYYRKGLS